LPRAARHLTDPQFVLVSGPVWPLARVKWSGLGVGVATEGPQRLNGG